ncbi:MAG: DivIVA domain-containing protein [Clostridia bacterium]|nr:DivIVA domain-containing protein [Clostridia bacterium]
METKDLFRREADGYSREDVETYIAKVKAEYKKIYEYATKLKSDNDKLKKIARALSKENKALKGGK